MILIAFFSFLLLVFSLPIIMPGPRSLLVISIPIVVLAVLFLRELQLGALDLDNGTGDLGDEFLVPTAPIFYWWPLIGCAGICVRAFTLWRGIGRFEPIGLILAAIVFLAVFAVGFSFA
jgi:hypothetical protein